MIYLSSFLLSQEEIRNPNIYPYSVFRDKYIYPFVFSPITIFYGNNGCGKSTLLNLIASKLNLPGHETYDMGDWGWSQGYIDRFVKGCMYDKGCDDDGVILDIPAGSRYIKSEDILYEIKKIQQEEALKNGYLYSRIREGQTKEKAQQELKAYHAGFSQTDILKFAQEKYSNGETAMQMLLEGLEPDRLYLLDEPEVSLSPENQVKLAENINVMARYTGCQFIIATHSPFLLGNLHARIYNLDSPDMEEVVWTQLDSVRFFYDFFMSHSQEFKN